MKKKPIIDPANPPMSSAFIKKMVPFRELFPAQVAAEEARRKVGRPLKAEAERLGTYTVRMSLSDIAKLREKGADRARKVLRRLANS